MAYELIYTSAPEGLVRGSSGFCVVACTKGMGPRLIMLLESLSAYKPLYPHYDENAQNNPVSRSHYICDINGEVQHILSRICFNGMDYTGRSNKLASHLILNNNEIITAAGGPASLFQHEELFKDASWQIKAEQFLNQCQIPATDAAPAVCSTWQAVMGDAGWAGVLTQSFMEEQHRNVYLAYAPEQHHLILPLLSEAIALLPPQRRWEVTFNTYFVNLPAGMKCSWRCCPAGTDALIAARRSPLNIIIDLTSPQELTAQSSWINTARTGDINQVQQPTDTIEKTEAEKPVLKLAASKPVARRISDVQPVSGIPQLDPMLFQEQPVQTHDRRSNTRRTWLIVSFFSILLLLAGMFIAGLILKHITAGNFEKVLADCAKQYSSLEEINFNCMLMQKRNYSKLDLRSLEYNRDELLKYQETVSAIKQIALKYDKQYRQQQPTEKNSKNIHPKQLLVECNALLIKLDNELTRLNQALQKKNRAAKPAKSAKPLPAPQKEVKKPAKPKAQPVKKAAVAPPVSPADEDNRFLWLRQPGLATGMHLTVRVGKYPESRIRVLSLSYNNRQEAAAGEKFSYDYYKNQRTHNLNIKVAYDGSSVKLTKSNNYGLPDELRLSIFCGTKEFPLYFKLGISSLYTREVKLEPQLAKKHLRIVLSGIKKGDEVKFFNTDDSICKTVPQLFVEVGSTKYPVRDLICDISNDRLNQYNRNISALENLKREVLAAPFTFISQLTPDAAKDYTDKRRELQKNRSEELRKPNPASGESEKLTQYNNDLQKLNKKLADHLLTELPLNKLKPDEKLFKKITMPHAQAVKHNEAQKQKLFSEFKLQLKSAKLYLKNNDTFFLQEKF